MYRNSTLQYIVHYIYIYRERERERELDSLAIPLQEGGAQAAGEGAEACLQRRRAKELVPSPFRPRREFPKIRVPYVGVLILRILPCRVLHWGPLFSETPRTVFEV